MTLSRKFALPISALAALAAVLPLLMAAGGGFPSRPRLLALGINTTVPATGNLAVASGITVGGTNVCLANGTNCPAPVTPAGSGTEVQYRSGGSFAGDSHFQYDATANYLALGNAGGGGGLRGTDSTSAGVAGAGIEIGAGNGNGAANGGALTLTGGSAGTAGNGGAITILGRTGVGASGVGSSITLTGGNGSGTGASGSINLNPGTGGSAAGRVLTNGVDITAANGTFTCTLVGFAANPSGTCNYSKTGNRVTLFMNNAAITGTSNAVTMTMTGLPAALQPANNQTDMVGGCTDNGTANILCKFHIQGGTTTITLTRATVSGSVLLTQSGWTNSGTKGIENGWTVRYVLD